MNDTQLYAQILGLPTSWQVVEVSLDPEALEVRVRVEPAPDVSWRCPECDAAVPG